MSKQYGRMGISIDPRVLSSDDDPAGGEGAREDVVITEANDLEAARRALERATQRWWLIDGAGREYVENTPEHEAWLEEQEEGSGGPEMHSLKYVSDIEMTPTGPSVYIDCQSFIPLAMRDAYLRVLVEELERSGVGDALVTTRQDEDWAG
jgi:hypothetical protein